MSDSEQHPGSMPAPRVTGADVVRTVLAFVETVNQASPEEVVELVAFLQGFMAAIGSPEEKARALDILTPDSTTPS